MQRRRAHRTALHHGLLWLGGLLSALCLAVPAVAGVLRSGQEQRMQDWLGHAPLPEGLGLGDIAIGKDQVKVQVLQGHARLGQLVMQPVGTAPTCIATSKTFDFSWQGPEASAALQAWWTQLAQRDPGGWWAPQLPQAEPHTARRPVLPWQLALWGPLWLLLLLGVMDAATAALTMREAPRLRWLGLALLVGVGVALVPARAAQGELARVVASPDGAAAVVSFAAEPLGALATVWCWHMGGLASQWPRVASCLAAMLSAGAVYTASQRVASSARTASVSALSAILLVFAALSPPLLLLAAGAVWLASARFDAAGTRMTALAGAGLMAGSAVQGIVFLALAVLWRLVHSMRGSRGAAGHDQVAHCRAS